jgi:transcription elongation factor Elf1
MRKIHCPKCGTDAFVHAFNGSYSYTCTTCNQTTVYTVHPTPSDHTATCPICSKVFNVKNESQDLEEYDGVADCSEAASSQVVVML